MITIEIHTHLNNFDRRALDRFFARAFDSDDYAATAKRIARTNLIDISLRDTATAYSELAEAHKLMRRAQVATGRTFNYSTISR